MTAMETQHTSLALLTDLYQLTMAYGYWKSGSEPKEAVFNLFFRRHPFQGGFSVCCGLSDVIEYLGQLRFTDRDLAYLRTLKGVDETPLFEPAFLDYLRRMKWACDVDAVPEGTLVFPNEPLLRVQGPIIQSQIIETALLNLINFQTLIATKAARVALAARGDPVIEFGLRRAQGVDGGLTASRAAFIGGCSATSNLQAGQAFGIPVKGTHAHSWVMSFDTEWEAFQEYARAMPNNCIFLVDTYNTLAGVRNAVKAGQWLRDHGHEMIGIRLDSGDLAYLSIEARKILDGAGFRKARILASNNLDEHIIASLKEQGAKIDLWGVGTHLVTAYDQPALGGIYKLVAIRSRGGSWENKIKISEQASKSTTPSIQQVRRFRSKAEFVGDAIYRADQPPSGEWVIVDPQDITRRKRFSHDLAYEDLLVPIFRQGRLVYQPPPLEKIRQRVREQLGRFHSGIKRFVNPHQYPVGLEQGLHDLKTRLILEAKGMTP